MSHEPIDRSRRKLLRQGFAAVTAVFMGRLALGNPASAQDSPRLSEDDPQAKALQYVHDASTVDNPARKEGATCANCMHWQADAETTWGGCALFPGKAVNKDGWCSAWVAKSG